MKLLGLLGVSAAAGGVLGYTIGALYIRFVLDRPAPKDKVLRVNTKVVATSE